MSSPYGARGTRTADFQFRRLGSGYMFKNLSTSTKLFILCTTFVVPIVVATYELFAEKQSAIDFTNKEISGVRQAAEIRAIYTAILTDRPGNLASSRIAVTRNVGPPASGDEAPQLERALERSLHALWSSKGDENSDVFITNALTDAQNLVLNISDYSNLSLDPELDSYYMQDIAIGKLPRLLGQFGEAQALLRTSYQVYSLSTERKARLIAIVAMARSTVEGIKRNLSTAYKDYAAGGPRTVNADVEAMLASSDSYLQELTGSIEEAWVRGISKEPIERSYSSTIAAALKAWATAENELSRLLRMRIDGLVGKLRSSLTLTGVLTALSLIIAVLTHRNIVRPLERLEGLARTVRQTRNYRLHSDYRSRDEVGRLATAFNDMLAELDRARERQAADQARTAAAQLELARVARLTTMGEMAASIAHEVNQPLAAIVTNGSAGLRWLKGKSPDLGEVRGTLERIVSDGHRASGIIGSIRTMLKKKDPEKVEVDLSDVVREVLALLQGELKNRDIIVETELATTLPLVLADRVQLQQVVLNLIMNGIEAMASVTDRVRLLRVRTHTDDLHGVRLTVTDSGTGIGSQLMDRIFDPFVTTKPGGMGMGLSICRSIILAYGGRLSASRGEHHGTVFQVALPASELVTND
jgi:C4-dicarboxylate-specific signal transduction histidine kinase